MKTQPSSSAGECLFWPAISLSVKIGRGGEERKGRESRVSCGKGTRTNEERETEEEERNEQIGSESTCLK